VSVPKFEVQDPEAPSEPAAGEALEPAYRAPDARVALDLRDGSDGPLVERPVAGDPREREHQRRMAEEKQAHVQSMQLLRLRHQLSVNRQNTPLERLKARVQAGLVVVISVLSLSTLCYLLLVDETPLELKKDILKYVGGAIGGLGIGYAIGRPREPEEP
jgi:hypothetical protein